MSSSQSVSEKAVRLLAEGRIEPAPAPVREFIADGDHGRYRVFVGPHTSVCTCPATVRCSHIEGAVAWVNASDAERALMLQALGERKAREATLAEELFAVLGS
jgi:hypothetical protein